jgi:DNA-binding transcriptional LysR family regulator
MVTVNLTHLKAFYMVAKNRSFTLACRELEVSQPTISLQVRELEKYCGNPLLTRNTKQIELTQEGKLVFPLAEKIFALEGEIENTIEEIRNLNLGTLEIGTTFLTLENLIPDIIRSIKDRNPGLRIHLSAGSAEEVLRGVIDYKYHLGIIGRLPYPNNIIAKEIQKMKLYFISKNEIKGKVYLEDLANFPVICPSKGNGLRELLVNEFRKRNITLNIQIESDNPRIIRSMVQGGLGGAFVPSYAKDEELEGKGITLTEIIDSPFLYLDAIFLKERRKSHFVKSAVSAIQNFEHPNLE